MFGSFNNTFQFENSPVNNYLTDSSVLNKEEPYFNRLFDFPSIALDNLNDYEIKGGIGKGAYAKVYQSKKKVFFLK